MPTSLHELPSHWINVQIHVQFAAVHPAQHVLLHVALLLENFYLSKLCTYLIRYFIELTSSFSSRSLAFFWQIDSAIVFFVYNYLYLNYSFNNQFFVLSLSFYYFTWYFVFALSFSLSFSPALLSFITLFSFSLVLITKTKETGIKF